MSFSTLCITFHIYFSYVIFYIFGFVKRCNFKPFLIIFVVGPTVLFCRICIGKEAIDFFLAISPGLFVIL